MNTKIIRAFAATKKWVEIGEGWDNLVFVDQAKEYAFRFPKKDDVVAMLQKESAVLPLIANHIENIPAPYIQREGGHIYAVYPFVSGEQYKLLAIEEQEVLLQKLCHVLHRLHALDIKMVEGAPLVDYHQKFTKVYKQVKSELADLLNAKQQAYAKDLFELFLEHNEYTIPKESLLHGDISFEHVYIKDNAIHLIDWSDLHVADPAYEFHHLLRALPREKHSILRASYETEDEHFWDRALLYPLMDTFEILLIFVRKQDEKMTKYFLGRLDHDMKNWKR